jgi:hypothetical protein
MNVHVHAEGQSTEMLYSPDNAHFCAIPGSPFAIDWSVTQKDKRVALTKRLVLFDYTHPICAALIQSIRNCPSLDTHLQRLRDVSSKIEDTFANVIQLLVANDPGAMEAFHKLPSAFQYGIYRETWKLFDSPHGIHGDFGRASFECDQTLNSKYHCDNTHCIEAVCQFAQHLNFLLVGSQFNLLFDSQSLVKGDNVLTMMKCAQLFIKDPKQGLDALAQLPTQQQEAVRFAFWELNECPRIHDYGSKEFARHYDRPELIQQRAHAILIAASRQKPRFDQPVIEKPLAPGHREYVEVIHQKIQALIQHSFSANTSV